MNSFLRRAKFWVAPALSVGLLGWMVLASTIRLWPANEDAQLAAPRPPLAAEEEGEGLGRRDWFYAQRAYPLGTIPPAARVKALQQLEREEARLRELSAAASDRPSAPAAFDALPAWTALGPAPIGVGQTFGNPPSSVSGRVAALALDPRYNGTTNQTVYLGAAQGGLWRSTDNGANWTPLTDDQPSLAMGAIAIDPTNPNIIYAGTGEGNRLDDTYYGAGLLKSIDGGQSWTQITGPVSTIDPKLPAFLNAAFTQLTIDPMAPSTIYACTTVGSTSGPSGGSGDVSLGQVGVWKSTDGGVTWKNLDPGATGGTYSGYDLLIDPLNHNRIFAAVRGQGIFRSTSGGENGAWERLAGGLPDATVNPSNPPFLRLNLAAGPPLAPSTNTTLYAVFAAPNDNLLGIWRSTDNGTTWTKLTNPQTPGQANYNLALAVDPVDANIIYYGTSANSINMAGTLWRSKDGGNTWTDLSTGNGTSGGLHADTHAIIASPANRNLVFTANDGGVWRSDNATANLVGWTSLNQTLNITQFQSIALHPTDPNVLIGGTQDNGTNRYNGTQNWFHSANGDGGFTLVDQSNPQVMYHTFFNQNNEGGRGAVIGPEISFNGGNTWLRRLCNRCTAQPGGFNPADRVSYYAPMALHPGFTGASGNVIYLGTHRLYRSSDQALTWTGLGASTDGFGADLTKNLPADPFGSLSYITAIAAHPALDQGTNPPGEVVWVGTGDGLVQFTTNAGALAAATFTNVTKAPLPNRFVTDIALDPGNQRRVFVTYSGFNTSTPEAPGHVFMTNDQGATWANISGDLPDVPVTSMAMDPVIPGTLYIGTDLGAFQTTDGGATWARLSNGMPKVAVFMLRYHSASRSLVAATHGRGVYRLSLPSPRAAVSVSAASFSRAGLASEAIASAFGTGLATTTQVATALPLPTDLAGTRVLVRDSAGVERPAPLFFVAPQQINYQIPPGTAAGTATIAIISGDGTVSVGTEQMAPVAPGLFSANADGQGVAAAIAVRVKPDGSQSFEPVFQSDGTKLITRPIDLGPEGELVVLLLYGTGIRFRSDLSAVKVSLGGTSAEVQYAGAQGGFVGLDQLNVLVPRSLMGRGEIEAALTVDGKAANTVKINIR